MGRDSYLYVLCEYERNTDTVRLLRDYIEGEESIFIRRLCRGELLLPSPVSIMLAATELPRISGESEMLLRALYETSRDFYESLRVFSVGEDDSMFAEAGEVFGQKFITILKKLRLSIMVEMHVSSCSWLEYIKYNAMRALKHPIYLALMIASMLLFVSLFAVSMDFTTEDKTLNFDWIIYIVCIWGISYWVSKGRNSSFKLYDNKGKDLLAGRYKELLAKVQGAGIPLMGI